MQERMICEIILALMAVTYFAGATYIYKKVSDMLEEIKALAMRGRGDMMEKATKGKGKK